MCSRSSHASVLMYTNEGKRRWCPLIKLAEEKNFQCHLFFHLQVLYISFGFAGSPKTNGALPASWHVWPHPLKQHFWVPVQLESIWQVSTQVAEEFLAGTGHIPSLDSEMTTPIVLLSTGVVLPENMRPRTISFLTSNEHEVVVHGEFVNAARSRGIASRFYGVCQGYKGTVVSELQIRIHTASPAIANIFERPSIPEYAYKTFGTGTIL